MSNTRRDFLKFSTLTVAGAAFLGKAIAPSTVFAQAAKGAKLPMVDEKADPTAKALGYHADATKVDTKKWAKRAGAEGAKQFCSNCLLLNGAKVTTEAAAPCSLFPNKMVASKGWCNSWVKNPAAK